MTVNCPVCKKVSLLYFHTSDFNRKITTESFNYFRCSSCNLIFLSPIPNDLERYYPNDYYSIPSSINDLARIAEFERYKIDIVKRFASRGRLLEIGPAYGSFIYLAKQAGFDTEAIEMDPNCCRFISETIGVKAIQSNNPADALNNIEDYNVIVLWHVIEHLPDPWRILETISKKLKPDGVLVIAAPNPKAFQFRVLGRFWPHVDAPRHVNLIPRMLLVKQNHQLGLKPLWSSTSDKGSLGWNVFGWVQFFMNMTRLSILKKVLGIIGRMVSIITYPIERLEDLGSAYTVVFQKEK